MQKHIVVLEDDTDILEMIEYLLSEKGLEVEGVSSAKTFWQQISMRLPDLIVLDIMLPDGNGVDICMKLKTDDTTKHIPIVLMSANMSFYDLSSTVCAEDFISKPFDVNDFTSRIEKQMA